MNSIPRTHFQAHQRAARERALALKVLIIAIAIALALSLTANIASQYVTF